MLKAVQHQRHRYQCIIFKILKCIHTASRMASFVGLGFMVSRVRVRVSYKSYSHTASCMQG